MLESTLLWTAKAVAQTPTVERHKILDPMALTNPSVFEFRKIACYPHLLLLQIEKKKKKKKQY